MDHTQPDFSSGSKHNKLTQKHAPCCLEMHYKWKQYVLENWLKILNMFDNLQLDRIEV